MSALPPLSPIGPHERAAAECDVERAGRYREEGAGPVRVEKHRQRLCKIATRRGDSDRRRLARRFDEAAP